MDFLRDGVMELADRVRRGELSAREVTSHALARIEALDPRINAFVALDPDRALAEAADVDAAVARDEDPGPLAGVPIGVKDLEDAAGFLTTHGSAVHLGDPPASEDSVLVARLRAAGCVVLGKTNTPEFGWKGDTENPTFGATRNPWDLERSPGGSSGGSAAAVAAGMVPLATGSDGGGSIRIPSALCGLSGLKPSLGRVPSGGPHPPDWCHLSTRGPIARSIRDVAAVLDVVVGPDPTDIRSLPMPESSWRAGVDDPHPPRRVGWSPTMGYGRVDGEVLKLCESAVRALEAAGTEVVEIDSVFDSDPVGPWLTLAATYNLRLLDRYRDTELWEQLDPGLVASMEWVSTVSAVDLVRAEDQAHLLNLRLVELFHRVPLLLTPAVAGIAPPSGSFGTIDGEEDANWVKFTYPFNLTRSPAGVVCAGFTAGGLPVGLQVIGPQHGDVVVLRALALLEDLLAVDRTPVLG